MSNIPSNLLYTKDHEWLSAASGTVSIGVTAYAIEQLGDIVHLDLPQIGDDIKGGQSFGTIESTKTVSDIYIPASGKVTAVNQQILDNPEMLCDDPYQNGWLIKVTLNDQAKDLLDSKAYGQYLESH